MDSKRDHVYDNRRDDSSETSQPWARRYARPVVDSDYLEWRAMRRSELHVFLCTSFTVRGNEASITRPDRTANRIAKMCVQHTHTTVCVVPCTYVHTYTSYIVHVRSVTSGSAAVAAILDISIDANRGSRIGRAGDDGDQRLS